MRLKVCKKCGKTFQAETGRSERYLCEECYMQAKKDSVYRERVCQICGSHFMGYPRSMFCPECSQKRKKEQKRRYNSQKSARPLGSIDRCEICGKEYIVKSGLQKYCPDCAEKTINENISARKKEYNDINKERLYAHKEKMRINGHVCVICGKIFDSDTATVTCSPECGKELQRIRQNESDIRRGKRKIPAKERYSSGKPQSGVIGVTYRDNGKWQATYKGRYLGVFETIDDAAKAIEKEKGSS